MSYIFYLIMAILVVSISMLYGGVTTYKKAKSEYVEKIRPDVEVEQMLNSERVIKEFLSSHNLPEGSSIYTIAKTLNIVDGGIDNTIPDRAVLTQPDENGIMKVVFKAGLSKEERLFDFAHECGHCVNGDPTPATRPEGTNKPQQEQVIDYTAAALLMPLEFVYRDLKQSDYTNLSRSRKIAVIKSLCKKYGVSKIIALRRIQEVYLIKGNTF